MEVAIFPMILIADTQFAHVRTAILGVFVNSFVQRKHIFLYKTVVSGELEDFWRLVYPGSTGFIGRSCSMVEAIKLTPL